MDNQTVNFATVSEKGVVTKVGKSTILQPKPKFKGEVTKWHDDNKLLKRNKA